MQRWCVLKIFSSCFSAFGSLLAVFVLFWVNPPGFHSDAFAYERSRPIGLPLELQEVGITEKLGEQVTIDELHFTNEAGERVLLSSYFNSNRPVLLQLIYYTCPGICNFMLSGLLESLKEFEWTPGEQFEVVTISIDPTEAHQLAAAKKANYMELYDREAGEKGWHFLTSDEENVRELARQVGFGYQYDQVQGEYAHSSVLFVLTPGGKISRYLYGIQYPQLDLRLSLLEASEGKIGTVVDRLIMFCYRYDPDSRGYAMVAFRVMQAGAGVTTIALGSFLLIFWRRQRRFDQKSATGQESVK
jgi:protein SCO1